MPSLGPEASEMDWSPRAIRSSQSTPSRSGLGVSVHASLEGVPKGAWWRGEQAR